jgi:hypothetical protein
VFSVNLVGVNYEVSIWGNTNMDNNNRDGVSMVNRHQWMQG